MKKILLSLIVGGGLALIAAPGANAASCLTLLDHSYAINIQGAEFYGAGSPTTPTPIPNPVAGLGVIHVGGGCVVSGELIYDDNDAITGPASCTPGGTALMWGPIVNTSTPTLVPITGTVPCFNGTRTQLSGSVSTNSANQGVLTFTDSVSNVTFSFAVDVGFGGANFTGNSIADDTQATTPPILSIIGQRQTLPIATAYGAAPWRGETTAFAGGVGTADGVNPGAFTASSGLSIINADATGGGSGAFNGNNDLFFFSLPLPTGYCHYKVTLDSAGSGPFPDGTANLAQVIDQPFTGLCQYANVATAFASSTVLYGALNRSNGYSMTTGSSPVALGSYLPPGGATISSSNPAILGAPVRDIVVLTPSGTYPKSFPLNFSNTSPLDCIVTFTLTNAVGGNFSSVCSINQAPSALNDQPCLDNNTATGCDTAGSGDYVYLAAGGVVGTVPAYDVYPGYRGTDSGAIKMTCTARPTPMTDSIKVASPNCSALDGTSIAILVQNNL